MPAGAPITSAREMIGALTRIETWLASLCLASLSVVIMLQVFIRYVVGLPLVWVDEVAIYLLIATIYIGSSVGVLDDQHFRVSFLVELLPRPLASLVKTVILMVWLAFSITVAWQGAKIVGMLFKAPYISPALGVPQQWPYLLLPVGFSLMALKVGILIFEGWRPTGPADAARQPDE